MTQPASMRRRASRATSRPMGYYQASASQAKGRGRKEEPTDEDYAFKTLTWISGFFFLMLLAVALPAHASVRVEVRTAAAIAVVLGAVAIYLWFMESRISWWWRAGVHALASMAQLVAFTLTSGFTREQIHSPLAIAIIVALSIGAAIGFANATRLYE